MVEAPSRLEESILEKSPRASGERIAHINQTGVEKVATRQVKMHKTFKLSPNGGGVELHLQFSDGQVVEYVLPISLNPHAAGYGALRKLGDLANGKQSLAELKQQVTAQLDRWDNGNWNNYKGPGGTSVVMKALMEHTGKSATEIKAFLASKTMQQKADIKRLPEVAAIVRRLAKPKAVASDLLDGLV
jgi:hypothetical protein